MARRRKYCVSAPLSKKYQQLRTSGLPIPLLSKEKRKLKIGKRKIFFCIIGGE